MNRIMGACSIVLAFAILQNAACTSAQATADKPPLPEMWTRLAARIDSKTLKEGDPFRVQVVQPWVYGTCSIQQDAMLEGRVVGLAAWSTASKITAAAVSFNVICANGNRVPLVLIAAFYPREDARSQMELYNSMPQGLGAGASGRQSTDLYRLPTPGVDPEVFPKARLGEVKGLRHLKLEIGKGAQGSTLLSTTDKRLRLEKGTRLALVSIPQEK